MTRYTYMFIREQGYANQNGQITSYPHRPGAHGKVRECPAVVSNGAGPVAPALWSLTWQASEGKARWPAAVAQE